MKVITANLAAERLGVTPARVRAMIRAGRLPAKKFGRDWQIREQDLRLVEHRSVGRPPKERKEAA